MSTQQIQGPDSGFEFLPLDIVSQGGHHFIFINCQGQRTHTFCSTNYDKNRFIHSVKSLE